MTKHCSNCFYCCSCGITNELCDYYMPFGEEAESILLDDIIEQGRNEFHEAWNEYTVE